MTRNTNHIKKILLTVSEKKRTGDFSFLLKFASLIFSFLGLISLLFEVNPGSNNSQIIYIARLIPTFFSFLVFVVISFNPGKNFELLKHLLWGIVLLSSSISIYFNQASATLNVLLIGVFFFFYSGLLFNRFSLKLTGFSYTVIALLFPFGLTYFQHHQTGNFESLLSGIIILVLALFSDLFSGGESAESVTTQSELPFLEEMIENSDFAIFRTDGNGKLLYFNRAFLKTLGIKREELTDDGIFDDSLYKSSEEKDLFKKLLLKQKRLRNYRLTLKKKNGAFIILRLSARVIEDEEGNIEKIEGSFIDITSQLRRENEARRKLELLRNEKSTALEEAKEALQRSKIKTQFLASMSHEIRTPMNSVLGFLTLIENELFEDKDELKEFAGNARTSAESLLDIINNILDISKIEAGKMELDDTEFSIHDELKKTESIVLPSAKEKGLDLNFEIDPDLPPLVKGDPTRFRQILVNLVSNAIKFTDSGSVTLQLQVIDADELSIKLQGKVIDTGRGIEPEQLNKLFKPYSQVKGDSPIKNQGAGLGLMICKEFVTLMGGDIKVESELGKGTTFTFTVNLVASENAQFKIEKNFTKQAAIPQFDDKIEEASPSAEEKINFISLQSSPRSKKRLLLVEDNPISQSVELKLLRDVGYLVDPVSSGADAIEAVKTGAFDLVLMDIEMSDMDGITATKKIRALDGKAGKIPIIAVTANSSMKDRERCLAAEMNDYISKPININFLKMTIDRWLNAYDN